MRSGQDYREQFQALLPPGLAFSRDPGSTLTKLLDGLAEEFARVEARGFDLIREVLPDQTIELLTDWERVAGLPDECTTAPPTVQERQQALVAKLTTTGGSSKDYFLAVASALGFDDITITEGYPFRHGTGRHGDRFAPAERVFIWYVEVQSLETKLFRHGLNRHGERFGSFGNTSLACVFNRIKPAHTEMIFIEASA